MENLPQDPVMLLSFVNTKLRDEYASLDALCAALSADRDALEETLRGIDYHYNEAENRFL